MDKEHINRQKSKEDGGNVNRPRPGHRCDGVCGNDAQCRANDAANTENC
ncbi:MAG: hypothetical protein QOH01_2031 [Verrucomicrobiota bacterium]|jgi:hypothetical protein